MNLRPADALCRSPEPACLRRLSILRRQQPARVTKSPTRSVSKTYRGDGYFFFRRLVVFFAVFFAAAFVFRFFAIAALLSLSGWRHRCSAVANRPTLQPDYYSLRKRPVLPPYFVYGGPISTMRTRVRDHRRPSFARKILSSANICSPNFNCPEMPMNSELSMHRLNAIYKR